MRRCLLLSLCLAPVLLAACGESGTSARKPAAGASAGTAAPTDGAAPSEGAAPTEVAAPTGGAASLPPTRVLVASDPGSKADDSAYLIEPPQFELGVLDPNQIVEVKFDVVNRGERPFNIVYLNSECRCLTLDYDRSMIQPGGRVTLRARIAATSAGQRTTAVTLHLSDPARSKPRVQFHYAIVPEVLVDPKKVELGRVETGKSTEVSLRVTLHLPDEVAEVPPIEPFVTHDLPIKLWMDEPTITPIAGGTRDWVTTLHVRLQSDKPIPPFESHVVFHPKEKKHFRELVVPLTGEVVPSWYFERGVVGFGSVAVGEETEKEMRFFFPGPEVPEIKKLETDLEGLEVSTTLDAERRCYVVKLKLVARTAGKYEGNVMLTSSLSSEPVTLRVTARAK